MAFSDEQIVEGFELLTSIDLDELEGIKQKLDRDNNPMQLKKELAFRVTSELKSTEEAELAQEYFESVFQKKTLETDLEETTINRKEIDVLDLIVEENLAPSKAQARRLIEQGAVMINGKRVQDWQLLVSITEPVALKVGKRILQITYKP
jgi:tyrosyl-tRNA synthetase